MTKINVLIADDMEIILQMLKDMLETNEEINVIGCAQDGEEAYEKILDLHPDLVFTDNTMPKLNGIDLITKINELHLEKNPQFVLVTGDKNLNLFQRANDQKVIKIIQKPICNVGILEECIEKYKEIKE